MVSKVISGFLEKPPQWRWGIATLLISLLFAAILFYHRENNLPNLDAGLPYNALLYSAIFALLLALFAYIISNRSENAIGDYHHDLHQNLRHEILQSPQWGNVVAILFKHVASVVPIRDLSLSLYDQTSGRYETMGNYGEAGANIHSVSCLLGLKDFWTSRENESSKHRTCPCWQSYSPAEVNRICLSITMGPIPVGMLHFKLANGHSLRPSQEDFLAKMAPEIAYIVDYIHLKNRLIENAEAIKMEQDRIAKHLHDSLAHNLAYLRLKLDQLAEEKPFGDTDHIFQEVERLRSVANESYEQVRSSLMELRRESPIDLTAALNECARSMADSAKFNVIISSRGEPQDLSPHIQRQILYVVREALRNSQKHAHANQAAVILDWTENNLTITSGDDGQGFDLDKASKLNGHYGLKIMREVVSDLKGEISIHTSHSDGTQVTLRIPLFPK